MKQMIQIYVRQSGDQVLLNICVPEGERAKFLAALSSGTFESRTTPIAVELSMLPKWVTDDDVRDQLTGDLGVIHARIPITAINVQILE
jgi:hypothetical protein